MRWICIVFLIALKFYYRSSVPQPHLNMIAMPASGKYSSPSIFEKLFFGSNYRREWETEVTMPVFDIKKTNFRIVQMGGGQQTTSLELVDDKNREWVLRSVDKNVQPSEKFLRTTFAQKIIQDHVSGAYPYAALSVAEIARAAGVPVGDHRLYFVPDDSSFAEHRSKMANKIFILVNTQPQSQKGIPTKEMLEKLKTDKQYYVDQQEYLKA